MEDQLKTFFLLHASQFCFGRTSLYHNRQIYIQKRGTEENPKWAFTLELTSCWCLGKDNSFHYEHNPSSRTEKFLQLTRFDTFPEAYIAWLEHVEKGVISKLTIT